MDSLIWSETTGRSYLTHKVVRIVNWQQAWAYMKYGVTLLDIYPSNDLKDDNKPVFVYIFDREDSREAYDLWCKRELVDGLNMESDRD